MTFTAHRGCFDVRRYSRSTRLPRAERERLPPAVRTFDDRYPWVRTYSAWNEVNHISQPTFTRPRLAVRYYRVCAARAVAAASASWRPTCSTPSNMPGTCGRSCAARLAGRACGGCTTTRTSTARTSADTRTMLDDRAGRGLADRDRDREVRQQPAVALFGVACGALHALDVPAGRPLRLAGAAACGRGSRGCTSTTGSARRPAPASTPGSSTPTAPRARVLRCQGYARSRR